MFCFFIHVIFLFSFFPLILRQSVLSGLILNLSLTKCKLMWLKLYPPIINPAMSSISLRIVLLHRCNSSSVQTHPCLSPHSLFVRHWNHFPIALLNVHMQFVFLFHLASRPLLGWSEDWGASNHHLTGVIPSSTLTRSGSPG